MQRRLAAILAADIVGYSRLMAADEAGTITRQKAYLGELIDPAISRFGGRIVKTAGDGLLAEFSSAVAAVQCAVEIQRGLEKGEHDTPEATRIRYRMGINLGDVVVDDDDILGDGVNVAARLESIAEPDGLCIADTVYQSIASKLDLRFEDAGEQALKNIDRPVRVWRWVGRDGASDASQAGRRPTPERTALAVLPFTNMSGDADQEYFADGLTEDLITELSRFGSLSVVARNSSFGYKGQSPKIQDVGRDLGVDYVVEGSVRRSGDRVRITAQLVEAASGNHVWAERFDRHMKDIFEVQDEVVGEIASAVPGQLDVVALRRARDRPTASSTAYDYFLRGEFYWAQRAGTREAAELYEKAIEIDPDFARAHARLAAVHAYGIFLSGAPPVEAAAKASSSADTAIANGADDPVVRATVAFAYLLLGEHDLARNHIQQAVELNPNDRTVMKYAGITWIYLGENDRGIQWLRRLSFHEPMLGEVHREALIDAYYMAGRYDDALALAREWRSQPSHVSISIAAVYAQLDLEAEAREALVRSGASLETVRAHVRMCARAEDREHWLEGYRKAGLDI